jgi:hypothetical protein
MKMSAATFSLFKDMVEAVLPDIDMDKERRAYQSANLSEKRWRWDLYWSAASRSRRLNDGRHENVLNRLNEEDLTDEHIDTALRKFCPALNTKELAA